MRRNSSEIFPHSNLIRKISDIFFFLSIILFLCTLFPEASEYFSKFSICSSLCSLLFSFYSLYRIHQLNKKYEELLKDEE